MGEFFMERKLHKTFRSYLTKHCPNVHTIDLVLVYVHIHIFTCKLASQILLLGKLTYSELLCL